MKKLAYGSIEHTPLGTISVGLSAQGLALVLFAEPPIPSPHPDQEALAILAQIDAYLQGSVREILCPIDWSVMTAFQQQVLQRTLQIPYGKTVTYQQIANELGKPGAARAVGQAEANNPMPLVIPCHRVIGSDGSMHGYGGRGGIETKIRLLKMEGHPLNEPQPRLF